GESIAGASVIVKGTTNGTATDADGNFTLSNVPDNAVLQVFYIGYKTQEISVLAGGGGKSLIITLLEDVQALEEIVVVGYGMQKKVNLTGAVSSVNFEKDAIASRPLTSASAALSGLSSGLIVRQSSGTPGSDNASINVRGVGTLNTSSPLIVIDGQPGDMNYISPSDIASISVLKDAASSAIYGSRGANGVILITTKSGHDSGGKITFSYDGNIGKTSPTKLYDLITNTADHMTLANRVDVNSGRTPSFSQEFIDEWRVKSLTDPILYPNTDWWDVILTPETIQNHSISARGGNSKINFFTSLNILDNNGLMENTAFNRITFRNSLTYQVNNWLKLGNILTGMYGKAEPGNPDSVFQWFLATTPGLLPKHPDGRYGGGMTGGSESGANNQLRTLEVAVGEKITQRYTGKVFAVVSPLKGLDITGSFYADMYNYNTWSSAKQAQTWNFQTETVMNNPSGVLSIANSNRKLQRTVVDIYADYNRSFGANNIHLLVGFNQEYSIDRSFSATKQDLYSLDVPVLDAAPTNVSSSGSATDYAMRSFFGRMNYDYAQKYLFEANLRADGSSRFAPDHRWGYFPSFSAGWRLSEETFWDDFRNTVDNLKMRVSWGQLGNNSIGNYDWQDVYAAANYSFNGAVAKGLAPSSIANNLISWETTEVFNVGFDANLFNKLALTLEYYNKLTHGILFRDPIPYVNGGLSAPMVNSAEVRNTGFEADLNYHTSIGKDFNFSIGLNASLNHNEIVKYKGDLLEVHSQGVWTEGEPIGKFYVREIDHIVQDKAEIDQMVADGWTFSPTTPGAGDFLYKDQNGDKKINDDDRVLLGNPIPLINYGANLTASWKGIDFYGLITGVSGWDRYMSSTLETTNRPAAGYLYLKSMLNSWTEENHSTTIPKIYLSDARNEQVSTYHLHDASYLRIKTLQLGYTVPRHITRKISVDKVRAYINLENYFTITSYPGMDPETTGSANQTDTNYPLMKTLSFGLNINF
ncbi:MAG: TonB-dependent receptor, partial [Tannerella sp.]|nr:TonB-dependent receptor [Tannerella sp.]